ncbi:MAG: mechanosensitive ion channel family protein [Pseudomonadota bacterium]
MDIPFVDIITQSVRDMLRGAASHFPNIMFALLALLLTLVVARIARSVIAGFMKRAGTRQALIRLFQNLIGIASWIVGISISATILFPSITPAEIIAGLGLTSVAIGFAFKDVFENFLAGVIILAREKMRIGDVIECEGVFGRIESIEIRETHIRDTDGELIIVPNAFLFKNPLDIETDQKLKRQDLVIGVDYDCDLSEVTSVLEDTLKNCNSIDGSKPTEVACINFGGSSIDFKLFWWTDSQPKAQRRSYHEVALAVKKALDDAGIGIPFPQTTLSFRPDATPIQLKTERPDQATSSNR